MARGGKRDGAGRPKGAPNKATAAKAEAIAESGMTPLDYLLSVYRDPEADKSQRLDAAKAAAPYVHPKRAPVDGEGETAGVTLNVYTGVPRDDADD